MELRSILTSTPVGDLTLTQRPTLSPADSVADAAGEMRGVSHGSAIICEDGRLSGIFTERDLLRVIAEGGSLDGPLADVMTSNPATVTVEDSLFDAVRLMDEGGYRRVPVVDGDQAPVGFVDVKIIGRFLVEYFAAGVHNNAAAADTVAKNPEGA